MKITIACVGKIKEKFFREALAEYSKRLSRYAKIDIVEVKDEKTPENASDAEENKIKETEGKRLLDRIPDSAYVIALAIQGEMLTSEKLAANIERLGLEGKSHIVFVIGGSLGLSDEVMQRADYALSFSRMTFPHQLMRVILLEQIYRSYRIINHEPYHK
ncbi:MAG: 23S rRNA (pseudouridine(1915)-N(3))-methyltransferase RlmH [Lachnospiraceae bacterium]|nr:23S rRNA (pseudouridine(1915)-N(3))-methyltransferase RlmH [Lachnospiraceae bacterium]